MKIHKILLSLLVFHIYFFTLRADEGMWLPLLIEQLNEAEMRDMGMKITAEDIYSINQSSMKDGVMLFGTGCTGSLISAQGLLITNHHCGLGIIQGHSSVENDYLTNGFWARKYEDELLSKSLTVTFMVRMEEVTARVLAYIPENAPADIRARQIQLNIDTLISEAIKGTHYEADVKPFYAGNEYYLFVKEKYLDVRLVGAPPSSIGKFGGDTDNWEWPRHTGDFSLFRIYTGPDGKPAPYSEDNIPLRARYYFPISRSGVEAGDFTMVLGYPYRTQEYLSSYGVELIEEIEHPTRVALRHERLAIIDKEMALSDQVRIQYTGKQSSIANGYKKWKGALQGLKKAKALEKKRIYEAEFSEMIADHPEWRTQYGTLLDKLNKAYRRFKPFSKSYWYFQEAAFSIELVQFAYNLSDLLRPMKEGASKTEIEGKKNALRKKARGLYKNYSSQIDQQIMHKMLSMYAEHFDKSQKPDIFHLIDKKYKGNLEAYTQDVFANSALVDESSFNDFLSTADVRSIEKDPAYQLMFSLLIHYYNVISPQYEALSKEIKQLNREYMQAQRVVFTDKVFYPDANFSMRLTYGKAEGYKPQDGVSYKYYTTLDGLIDKYTHHPDNPDYKIPERLLTLYLAKDFGSYAHDGQMRTAFIASMHTSGGNSGSPVINGEGHLVGLNFDRNWQGAMSDIFYDPAQCRNISVDIRYILFIIDKFAGADYLIREMRLVSK